MRKVCLLLTGIFFSLLSAYSQSKYTPHILAAEEDRQLLQKFSKSALPSDSSGLIAQLQHQKEALLARGYLTSSYFVLFRSDSALVYWNLGHRFQWTKLEVDEEALALLGFNAYREKDFLNQTFQGNDLIKLSKKILEEASNKGYPFASVRFLSPSLEQGQVSLMLDFEPGPKVVFDSIAFPENVKINDSFLKKYLGLASGQAYQEQAIKNIPDKIRQLPYVQITGEPEVSFANHRSKIYLPLSSRKANRLDGIIGLAPANELSNKAQLTGQLDLELHNLFKTGKYLSINWQKLRPLSQSMDLKLMYPVFLGSPMNLNFGFQLFKEDTSFLRRETLLSFSYASNARQMISGGVRYKNSNLLSTLSYENSDQTPPLLDSRSVMWEMAYQWSSLNDAFDPTRGAFVMLSAAAGNRTLEINPRLNPEIYEQINTKNTVFDFQLKLKKYFPTTKNQHIYTQLQTSWLHSDNLFQNELYRLGGLKSIRGFSENYFYASRYVVLNIEYRIRFEEESYVFAFYDQSYLYYKVPSIFLEDFPRALGLGLNIKLTGGILSVAYALGSSAEQSFGLANSRIHIGFVGRF